MSTYVSLPSDVEATCLAELVDDCRAMPAAATGAPKVVDLPEAVTEIRLPSPRRSLVIPDAAQQIAGAFGG